MASSITIKRAETVDRSRWDTYVLAHPNSNSAHLFGWKHVIESAYSLKSYYLLALINNKIVGVLPAFNIKSKINSDAIVSMPFMSYGGVLAENVEYARELVNYCKQILKDSAIQFLEMRFLGDFKFADQMDYKYHSQISHKVTMLLNLPSSSEELFKSYKAKLRSQIRRAGKEGMETHIGGSELVNDFYRVFAINMRDLGSPVHSKKLFVELADQLSDYIKIGVVYHQEKPVASGIIILFNGVVEIPWASSLREYNRFSPNMQLYWKFLEYSSDNNFKQFDFGRSSPDESTFRFKKQWGAEPHPLNWHFYSDKIEMSSELLFSEKESNKMKMAIKVWQKMPVNLTKILGPVIRKTISL